MRVKVKLFYIRALIGVLIVLCFSSISYGKGFLHLTSADSSIQWKITIDGESRSYKAGMEIILEDGRHQFIAIAEGYQPIDNSFVIRNGEVIQVTLTATRPKLVETTKQQSFYAAQKISRLVVVARPGNVRFAIDEYSSKTPASFTLGVGKHKLIAGSLSEQFDVLGGKVTYLQIDTVSSVLKNFSMTEAQEREIQSTATSRNEIFKKGFQLYGENIPWWEGNYRIFQANVATYLGKSEWMKIEYISIGLIVFMLCFFLYLRLRFSLKGRAKAMVRRKINFEKQLGELNPEVSIKEKQVLEKKLSRQIRKAEKFTVRLEKKVANLQKKEDDLSTSSDDMKKKRKLQVMLKKNNLALEILAPILTATS